MIYSILGFLWFLRQIKSTLFWLYLWQLKEYHIGRFIDHFRTEKGKQLFLNKLFILKILLLFTLFTTRFALVVIYILLFVYLFESIKGFKDFLQQKLKKPVLTIKTVFLISITLVFQILFILLNFRETSWFVILLLLFDILTSAIISGIVLFLQPLTVLIRNQVIRKAKRKREKFKDILVIGITGSYGKTSIKEFLATILSEKFKVLKTAEHQNSEVGISQCILNDLKSKHEIFIVEMGAYNRGGIKLLCGIAKPKIGILTGINEQHLALFGSQENIIKTKYELIENLPRDGLAIFNGDNSYCFKLYQRTLRPNKVYSIKPSIYEFPVDIWVENIKIEKDFIVFEAVMKDDRADFKVNLLGAQNISNILAAALVAKELGMTLKEISQACKKIKLEQGATKLIKTKKGLNIIDSTYSANPDGVLADLEYLKIWPGQKVIVMPCLIELGKSSKEIHQRIGERIGEVCDLIIITTKEKFKEIKKGAIESGQKEENILFLKEPKEITKKIETFCQPEDVILLESRVPKGLMKLLSDQNEI